MPEPMKPVSWPDHETVRVIGRGSSSTVYEIRKSGAQGMEKAALKVISLPQSSQDDPRLKNAMAAHALVRKLDGHPQIVQCEDLRCTQRIDSTGWDLSIKMELLTPLTKALPQQIPEQAVLQVAQDMCLALEQCQKHGILHGNIKPQNIFAANGVYKLGDFRITGTTDRSKPGACKYMAPELYSGQPCGTPTDIYSLGLVLYWMLNERRLPFLPLPPAALGPELEEAARKRRCSGEPVPPPKNGSDRLKAIVLRACAFDPNARYQDAAQMLSDLRALQGAPAPAADPVPRPAERTTKKKKDKKKGVPAIVWIAVALILVAAIAAAAYFLLPRDGGEDDGPTTAPSATEDTGTTPTDTEDTSPTVAPGGPVTVTFDPNGLDIQLEDQTFTHGEAYGALPELTRKGHTFDGWYTENDKRVWNATEVYINKDHTLYARWTPNTYTIVLDPCGGRLDNAQLALTYDQPYGELPQPTKKGCTFDGWYTAAEGGEQIQSDTILATDRDHTLYAHWTSEAYTVTLDPNGGTVSQQTMKLHWDEAYGELPKPTRKGHTFEGWYTESGKKVYATTQVYLDADHTLYAQWSPSTYTVTLDPNGGTIDTTTVDLVYDQPYGDLPRPTREGYTFEGWYTALTGGERVWKGTHLTTDQDHTLYAHWS